MNREGIQNGRSPRVLHRETIPAWLRYGAIAVVLVGIFLRFYNLDYKVYWLDEAHTSLRMSGHTRDELVQEVFTGQVITAEQLLQYQQIEPDKGWDDTLAALKGNAEHSPLYFLMARQWVEWWGYSVWIMRLLPALLSLLIFPAIAWLGWELFGSTLPSWIAMALVAVSPIHVYYAQEARPYSLLTALVLVSGALLLRARRTGNGWLWVAYGGAIAAGLYTQLLFGLVAIAHGLYIALLEPPLVKGKLTPTMGRYLVASLGAIAAFVPWLLVLVNNFAKVQRTTASLSDGEPLAEMIDQWFLNMSRVFVDRELGSFNLIFILLSALALIYLWRTTTKPVWLFVLLLAGVSFLALAIPDLILGGQRSLRIRYLLPFYFSLQIAVAYLFAQQAVWAQTWGQKFWRMFLVVLIWGGLMGCSISSQAQVWWTKSNTRSGYYPVVSSLINAVPNPLIVSDGPIVDMVALSYHLRPDVKLQLLYDYRNFQPVEGHDTFYLVNPSQALRTRLRRQGYDLVAMMIDTVDPEESEARLVWARVPQQAPRLPATLRPVG